MAKKPSDEYLRFGPTGKYLLPRRDPPDVPPSRRRALRLGAVALAGSVAGCASGMLREESESDGSGETEEGTTGTTPIDEPTTQSVEVATSLPAGGVEFPAEAAEFPDGPKSPPERPAELTAESVREYVQTFEYRYVYNSLHYDETSEVTETCGVDSVTEYGEGFRVVVWCTASSNTERNGTTIHADYFTQYATYFVGPDTTVRYEGESVTRD